LIQWDGSLGNSILSTFFDARIGGIHLALDPIFKISVNETDAKYKSGYNGKMYYFCAACSKKIFDEHPRRYIESL